MFPDPDPDRVHLIVSRHGKPAAVMSHHRGWPAYESENGIIYVMECLLAFQDEPTFGHYGEFAGAHNSMRLIPRSYGMVSLRAPDGLAALHDNVDALWTWRPKLYMQHTSGGFTQLGSQQELAWRLGLHQAQLVKSAVQERVFEEIGELAESGLSWEEAEPRLIERLPEINDQAKEWWFTMDSANDRARKILMEHLDFQQRLDLNAWGHFYVRGKINKLYEITPGNGFAIVDPVTHEESVRFCLHPEEWIPDDDVCLATKLAIDDGEKSEAALMEAANPSMYGMNKRRTRELAHATRLEEKLGVY